MAAALLEAVSNAVYEVRAELAIFIFALCVHAVLFGSYRLRPTLGKKAAKDVESKTRSQPQPPQVATLVCLAKQLLRQGASSSAIVDEIAAPTDEIEDKDVCSALASVLESTGRNSSAELVTAVRTVVRNRGLKPSQGLVEVMMRCCLAIGLQPDFADILAEAEAAGGVTTTMTVLALRSTLRTSDLQAAMEYLRRFAATLSTSSATASSTLQQLLPQLLQMADRKAAMMPLLHEFAQCGLITEWVMETALTGSAAKPNKGHAIIKELEELAHTNGVNLTDAACAAIVRGTGSLEVASRIFSESTKRGSVGKELLVTVLDAARVHRSDVLVQSVLPSIPKSPAPEVAAALLRTLTETSLHGKDLDAIILDTYEKFLAGIDVLADARAGQLIAEAALRQKRHELLQQLLQATSDQRRRVALLKAFGSEGRLRDAKAVFHACPEKTICLYNALLDACIDCNENEAAEQIMAEAIAANMADVVTYNTIIKKHLQRGHIQSARGVIEVMRSAGGDLSPNTVTFNELLDAAIRNDGRGEGVWVILEEMKACGLSPTTVTCSILLKSVQQHSGAADVERVLAYVDALADGMDEVLLSSVCEACIRAGRADILRKELQRQRGNKAVPVNGAQTYGSIIRGYGFLKDINGARESWRQMRRRQIIPTSITIGCMVEALVLNGDPQGGFDLVHELSADEETKPLLNVVIYCSVLKGFTHLKMFDRVWVVYEEMVQAQLSFSIVTYNALIDACARAGDMSRVQTFLDGMAQQQIQPNLVTYSTILKGYCQERRMDKAFDLLEAMKKSHQFRPDEITYNTLIDGCAQRGMYDQGMKLLQEMQDAGVKPSTFTLSVLVKLANRGKRPDRAFELVEELATKYRLQPNVHVFANLVHTCTAHGKLDKGLEVLGRMSQQRVRPDLRTYSLLLRACVAAGDVRSAAGLVRLAFGLRGGPPLPQRWGGLVAGGEGCLKLRDGLPAELVAEVLEGVARCGNEDHLAVQLCKDLRAVPGLKLDPKLSLSLTSQVLRKPY
mmetsp:Transcript_64432/g.155811  ORF Transcript_64432/g.155811 Transcript_64432/m.155811 type:complete len:1019 (-) Transcript_64432:83-3139(-)